MFLPASLRSGTAIADITQLRLLERLPGTAIKMENMRAASGAPRESVHVLRDATEAAIKCADLGGVRVLAFATHGLMASEFPGSAEPGLVFPLSAVASENEAGSPPTAKGLRACGALSQAQSVGVILGRQLSQPVKPFLAQGSVAQRRANRTMRLAFMRTVRKLAMLREDKNIVEHVCKPRSRV